MSNFAGATVISGASGGTTGSNMGGGVETGEPLEWSPFGYDATPGSPTVSPIATVWWKWTCPASNSYFFNTSGSSFPTMIQVFNYSGVYPPTVAHPLDFTLMTEVTYLQNQSSGMGGGFHYASQVAFDAGRTTVYYIRVDGRAGISIGVNPPAGTGEVAVDPHGNITLNWGTYYPERLGSCTGCVLDLQSEQCLGTAAIGNIYQALPDPYKLTYIYINCTNQVGDVYLNWVTGSSALRIVSGSGNHKIRCCNVEAMGARSIFILSGDAINNYKGVFWGGSYVFLNGNRTDESYIPYTAGDVYWYNGSLYTCIQSFVGDIGGVPGSKQPPCSDYWTAGVLNGAAYGVEPSSPCWELDLPCNLGDITLNWVQTSAEDYGIPNLLPKLAYQLIYNPLLISMLAPIRDCGGALIGTCAVGGSGGHWSNAFGIQNLTNIEWPVTLTLLNTGGISNASAPQNATLPANSTIGPGYGSSDGTSPVFTFDADPSSQLITATLQISICGIVVGNLTYPMYPAVSITDLPSYAGEYTYTPNKFWGFCVQSIITYEGHCKFWGSNIIYTVTASDVLTGSPLLLYAMRNNRAPAYTLTDCGGPTPTPCYISQYCNLSYFAIQAQSTARQVLVMVQLMYVYGSGSINLPAYQQVITVPAA
jgi:hypothetical protein